MNDARGGGSLSVPETAVLPVPAIGGANEKFEMEPVREGKGMNKLTAFVATAALVLSVSGVEAAASKTTEYHLLGTPLTADKVLNIVLPDGVFLSGYVKDQSGKPVVNAFVGAALTDDNVTTLGGYTDASGKFTFPVQPGTYGIVLSPPTSDSVAPSKFSRLVSTKKDGVTVTGDTSAGTITMPAGNIWSGKVLPPSGTLGFLSAILWTFQGGTLGWHAAQFGTGLAESTQFAIALPSGSYKAVLLPLQAYTGTYTPIPAGYATSKFTISGDKVMNMKLKKGYKLSGTVKDSAGTGMEGLLWIYQKSAAFVEDVYVGIGYVADGKYETYLPNGSYSVVFLPVVTDTPYNGKGTRTEIDVVMPAGSKTMDIVADNGVVLSGKITDAKKKLAKGATVMARDVAQDPWGVNQVVYAGFTWTTNKGQYRFTLPQGTYDILSFPDVDGSAPQTSGPACVMSQAIEGLKEYKRQLARAAERIE